MNLMRKLWKNEGGFVISVELILIVTILVIGLVSGWTMLRDAVLAELGDTANAIGAIDQSYGVGGANYDGGIEASSASFAWGDLQDAADSASGTALTQHAGLAVTIAQIDASGNTNETSTP